MQGQTVIIVYNNRQHLNTKTMIDLDKIKAAMQGLPQPQPTPKAAKKGGKKGNCTGGCGGKK